MQINIKKVGQKFKSEIEPLIEGLKTNAPEARIKFKTEIEQLIEGLKTDAPEARIKINQEAEKQGRNGFYLILDAVNEGEGDLTKVLIVPVRDAFKNNQGAFELKDELGKVISPSLAKDIAKAYDHVSRRISTFSSQSEYLVKRVRADDDKAKRELEHDERYTRLLYHNMRKAISARAEFFLQTKAKGFEQALESLVDEQIKRLKVCLSEEQFSSINLEKAALSNLHKNLAQTPLTLDEEFFELLDPIKTGRPTKTEVVDTETKDELYTEYYQEGSWLKSTKTRTGTRTVTVNITEDVEYIELFLPSVDLMAQQWLSGIEKEKVRLWDILLQWILKRLDDVSDSFQEAVDEITNLAERALQKQLSLLEENFEDEKQFWLKFELQKDNATSICQNLGEDFCKV